MDHPLAGSGKTILVSVVINRIQDFFKEHKTVGLAYFYIEYLPTQKLTTANLVGLLISQLLRQVITRNLDISQAGLAQALSLFDLCHREGKSAYPSQSQIEELFVILASSFFRTFVIIDGIDEFED